MSIDGRIVKIAISCFILISLLINTALYGLRDFLMINNRIIQHRIATFKYDNEARHFTPINIIFSEWVTADLSKYYAPIWEAVFVRGGAYGY